MLSQQVWNALLQMKEGSLPFHDQFRCLDFRILESRLLPTVAPKTCGWLAWRIPASGSEEFQKIGLVFISWRCPMVSSQRYQFSWLTFLHSFETGKAHLVNFHILECQWCRATPTRTLKNQGFDLRIVSPLLALFVSFHYKSWWLV